MTYSHPQSPRRTAASSLAFSSEKRDIEGQESVSSSDTSSILGTMNDDLLVRKLITEAIKQCGKSRQQIAEEMSALLAVNVTERMITSFTSESKELHRWPGAWDRAFCAATRDDRLLVCRVELAGYRVISGADVHLLEIGRQYITRKRSEAALIEQERALEGQDIG